LESVIKFIRKHKVTIFITFIIGIILLYIKPFLDYIGEKFVSLLLGLSDKYNELYYSVLAKNNPYSFDAEILVVTVLIWLLLLWGWIIYEIHQKYSFRRIARQDLIEINTLKNKIVPEESESEIDVDSIVSKLEELEIEATKFKDSLYKRNHLKTFTGILFIFISLLFFFEQSLNESTTKKYIDFRNRTIILNPYVEISEINKLNSDDYKNLIEALEKLEKEYLK